MPTTTIHGALERALMEAPAALEALLGGQTGESVAGVTDRPPPGFTLAPSHPTLASATLLRAGETLTFTLTLLGEARRHEAAVVTALYRAAEGGLGARSGRAKFEVAEMEARDVSLEPEPVPSTCDVCFESPLRIKHGGKITSVLDAAGLWGALVRRAVLVARFHGGGALVDGPVPPPPFSVTDATVQRVTVRRHSSRQGRAMAWPGLVGSARLTAGGDAEAFGIAWQLLAFAQAAQLGKGTSFGFGKIRVKAQARSEQS